MNDFWIYFNIGLNHVLDFNAYDHMIFLLALTLPYDAKAWKRLLILVSIFTLGHTISLFLSVFDVVKIKPTMVEILIPITILITAIYNLISQGKKGKNDSLSFVGFVTLFFGIIHGLGFSGYFNSILPGNATDKLWPLLEFALGIETAQITIVILALIIGYVVQTLFKFSKRDWILSVSSFIIGIVMPLIINNEIWSK
ncbi:HupE/UreJ family protein [Flavobacterium sp.]|uniref:HupE/UreJ family protein n=1 Tax=Flavobacterium sp. TaxID=239 RepID=UPI0035AFAC99